MTGEFFEDRPGENLRVKYRCNQSTRDRVLSEKNGIWLADLSLSEAAGLNYTSVYEQNVIDSCDDGSNIDLKYYEAFRGILTGNVWPDNEGVHFIVRGIRQTARLECAYGTTVCVSARPSMPSGTYWGLPPDNPSKGCDECCYDCPLALIGNQPQGFEFVCGN